jgi:hypothetical protein
MRKRDLIRELQKISNKVNNKIALSTDQSSLYSRGLAGEGYLGGYRQAISDVILLINAGIIPDSKGWF